MSFPILLQGKILGIDEFLTSPIRGVDEELTFIGRARWVTLLSEILPRAMLAELGLAQILLGSSGGGQFLMVIPMAYREQGEAFLQAAAAQVDTLSEHRLSLIWAFTENLGDWTAIRRRLGEELARKTATPLASSQDFSPFSAAEDSTPAFFAGVLASALPDAARISWSPEEPARVTLHEGKHSWSVKDDLQVPRHTAPGDSESLPATTRELGARATGLQTWGVLRGNVDQFEIRLRRSQTDVEHLQLAIAYQSFFAEELEMLCSQPEYWRKVSILTCGGAEFSVFGSWDALIALAREVQRLFHRFAEANLKELPGAEGKTITMALALANHSDEDTLAAVFRQATQDLQLAKSAHKDSFQILGRTLEWKHLADASGLKDSLVKLVEDYEVPASSIRDLQSMYRETQAGRPSRKQRVERPWRYMRRINRVLESGQEPARTSRQNGNNRAIARGSAESTGRRDFQKLRRNVVADLVGRNSQNVKLRPSGRVALEWARLATTEGSETK
jgi:CRISPR-associated protein Csm1